MNDQNTDVTHGVVNTPDLANRDGDAALSALKRLEEIERLVAEQAERNAESHAAMTEAVERLEKSATRIGHEQFKANATFQAMQKEAQALTAQLREASASQEREILQLRDRIAEAGSHARADMVRRILPALDGLDAILESGLQPERRASGESERSRWHRFDPRGHGPAGDGKGSRQAASLEDLRVIRDRLLEALSSAGVAPMETSGCAFDPRRHVAVDSVPASDGIAPGAIVSERRRGYLLGDEPLRLAQVVVAKEASGERK